MRAGAAVRGRKKSVSHKVGPRSQSDTDFDWSAWHRGDDDAESSWTASETTRSEKGDSASGPSEPGQGFGYEVSDSPPPVIDAFPEDESRQQEPLPAEAAGAWSVPWPVTVTVIGAGLIVVVLVIAIVHMATNNGPSDQPSTAAPSTPVYREPSFTTSSTMPAPPPVTVTSQQTVTVTSTPPTTTAQPYDSEADSLQQLQGWANADRQAVLNGATQPDRWVPQLSSKMLGTVDNGVSYNYERILQDFLQLKNRYPGANLQLLRSGDWSTFEKSGYWVTIAGVTYPTSGGALEWCREEGLDSHNCFAKLISTTHSADHSTAYQ
jgi:serine/threonine-protein kinase